MANKKRVDVKKILADPDARRRLMVSSIRATQAREGIKTTGEQARRAYFLVTEGERTAFFALSQFRSREGSQDLRHSRFVSALRLSNESQQIGQKSAANRVRFDVRRIDFSLLEGSPLVYRQVRILAPIFSENAKLGEAWAAVRGGMNSTASERFVRYFWEVTGGARRWVRYSKGGSYARFYADLPLVLDWTNEGAELKALVKDRYGSESRFIKSPEFYFKRGLTWTEKSSLGLSVRILEQGAIFNVAGPAAFPLRTDEEWYLLGVLNSSLLAYAAWALSGRNYGADYVAGLPIAKASQEHVKLVTDLGRSIHDAKASWDHGNELSTKFERPWILLHPVTHPSGGTVREHLSTLADTETAMDAMIGRMYSALDGAICSVYGLSQDLRDEIVVSLGSRPPEVIWPQMESKSDEQKRMEHVWRLLSYVVKCIVEADEDGIVPFLQISNKVPLIDRVHTELAKLFPDRDVTAVEVEIVNELKRKVKGYDRADSIPDWIENVYFAFHVSLYRNRPIFWHIASSQGKRRAAFSALVHYHRFDKDRMAKLRGTYLREVVGAFRREAALAGQEGRSDDRLEWQSKVEEAEDLDRRLQRVQEGYHKGAEDYRILTPWKTEAERPKGWDPDINDGVKVNIEPLQRAGVLGVPEVV